MADLSRKDRRAQILLITGFALAVIFVGLAVVLNSVIYTENLATRAEITTDDPIKHTNTMESGTEEVLRYINDHNTSGIIDYSPLERNLSQAFDNLSTGISRHEFTDGQVTNDSLGTAFEGTWIKQTNESRVFTNSSGAAKWSPVETGANGARTFRIFVSDTTVLGSLTGTAFTVKAMNSTATWQLEIGTSSIEVTDAAGNTFNCGSLTSLSEFWVNVSAGTVAGNDCAGLDFAGDIYRVERINFTNADRIKGTYRLMVNKSEDQVPATNYGSNPFKEPALYGANIEIDFERKNLRYRTTVRVIPGEENGS